MRYLVGFGLVLALVASPLSVVAQTAEEGSDERPQLAFLLIPKHLQERLPQHRHAVSEPESKFSLEYQEQKSPTVGVDPLSGGPEATAIVTEEGQRRGISKGGKIAIGVLVPLVVLSVGVGVGFAKSLEQSLD